jgi:hypothetical protein
MKTQDNGDRYFRISRMKRRGAGKGGFTRSAALSVAATYRRINRTMQIALSVGLAFPYDRLAAARQITDGITFDIGAARACQLDDDAYGLVGFLYACLDVADVLLLGGHGVPSALLRKAVLSEQETGECREDQAREVHF